MIAAAVASPLVRRIVQKTPGARIVAQVNVEGQGVTYESSGTAPGVGGRGGASNPGQSPAEGQGRDLAAARHRPAPGADGGGLVAVIAADNLVGKREQVWGRDGHGTRMQVSPGTVATAMPARVVSEPGTDGDPATGPVRWVLAVDPALWPLAAGVELAEPGEAGRSWTVVTAHHRPSNFGQAVSYVRVEASLDSA